MYFAALLARTEDGWEVSDTELEDVETLADLADLAREASADDDTVLVLIEQEDAWFGVVRVDGEDDPRIYVSNAEAAAHSSFGWILLSDEVLAAEFADEGADALRGPIGDHVILEDLGVSQEEILALSYEDDPLTELAELLGSASVFTTFEATRHSGLSEWP
ncbi:hypothetical protein [Streptomyces sp. NPDC005799]|uniref:tRNA adenosine deaminase-associated protein n=1 Tax=Streptomyces sp. NPDC005799 TaxID=3154678 RepID=UPI0033E40F0B